MTLERRARVHAALGDPGRLRIVDALSVGDRTVTELRVLSDVPGNLLAHHLDVLEGAGLIERRRSEGDHRRRYVVLRFAALADLEMPSPPVLGSPLFVCTHNSARSQFAAALWQRRTGQSVESAGTDPAPHVHPTALMAASHVGPGRPGSGGDVAGHRAADRVGVGEVSADRHLRSRPSGSAISWRSRSTGRSTG